MKPLFMALTIALLPPSAASGSDLGQRLDEWIRALVDHRDLAGGLVTASEENNLVTVSHAALRPGVFRSAHLEIETPLETGVNLQVNRGGDIRVHGIHGLVEVTNLNGSVELCLPPTLSARVHLTTAGDPIRSDFRIDRVPTTRTIAPGEELAIGQSEVRGQIGSGETRLGVSTLNGEIYLRRCDQTLRRPATGPAASVAARCSDHLISALVDTLKIHSGRSPKKESACLVEDPRDLPSRSSLGLVLGRAIRESSLQKLGGLFMTAQILHKTGFESSNPRGDSSSRSPEGLPSACRKGRLSVDPSGGRA